MLPYVLFFIGIFFISWGIFSLQPRKRSKKDNQMEQTTEKMLQDLEVTAKTILEQIEEKASETRDIVQEGEMLLNKIKKVKEENISSISNNLLLEKQKEIQSLLDAGKSLAEVAKILDMGKGEIQLILDLHKGRTIR